MKETHNGRWLLQYRNKQLSDSHRNSLIKEIVEEALSSGIQIRIHDYPLLLEEIVWLFPSEENLKVIFLGFQFQS